MLCEFFLIVRSFVFTSTISIIMSKNRFVNKFYKKVLTDNSKRYIIISNR
uniref:Uncharacterized protein n=1 Tax=Siphoviridae sp. cto6l14 TaxID=2827590 RepID=A0A8S5LPK9_9CAUD|nr:MAG TPA: hypothetical protein [Siphoviridae sp. cto6l14]